MDDRDWNNYLDLFAEMTSYLKKPDLIIYLKASTDSLISRIKKRGRDYEQSIDLEYLHLLNIRYEEWIRELETGKEIPILTINTDGEDFVDDLRFRHDIFMRVLEKLQLSQK